jgi:hypothetical protein
MIAIKLNFVATFLYLTGVGTGLFIGWTYKWFGKKDV